MVTTAKTYRALHVSLDTLPIRHVPRFIESLQLCDSCYHYPIFQIRKP